MAEFNQKIKLYLGRNYTDKEILLRDDGNGPYVDFWLDSLEKPKPTEEQLNALESEANAIEAKRRELIREYAPTSDNLLPLTFRAQGNDTYALEIRSLTTQQAQQLLTFLEYGYGVDDPRTYRGNHD